jgi:hypothetical protein
LSASSKSTFDAWNAGTNPNSKLVALETIRVNAGTPPSMPVGASRTTSAGVSANNARAP